MRKLPVFVLSCVLILRVMGDVTPLAFYDFEGELGNGKAEGAFRYAEGIRGQSVVLRDSRVMLPCPVGLTPEEGAITFWMKPLNWDIHVKEFVTPLSSNRPSGDGRLMFYKYMKSGEIGLSFWYGNPEDTGKHAYAANYEHENLTVGAWHFIGLSWSRKSHLLRLYMNGKQIASNSINDSMLFESLAPFVLNEWPYNPYNRTYETAFDLLTFYPRPLSADEMKLRYEREPNEVEPVLGKALLPTILSVPKLASVPKIDGHFRAEEWSGAARVGSFQLQGAYRLMPGDLADAYLGCDDQNLYLSFISRITDSASLQNKVVARDGAVLGDDSWEVRLRPAGETPKNVYQGVFNYVGAIYDALGGNRGWNGRWQVRNGIYEGFWSCEVAIPLSEFGSAFRQDGRWHFNVFRHRLDTKRKTSTVLALSPTGGSRGDALGEFRLTERDCFGRLSVDQDLLNQRRLKLTMETVNQSDRAQTLRLEVLKLSASGKVLDRRVRSHDLGAGMAHSFVHEDALSGFRSGIIRVTVSRADGQIVHRQDLPLLFQDHVQILLNTRLTAGRLDFKIDMNSHYQLGKAASIEAILQPESGKALRYHPEVSPLVEGSFDLRQVSPGDCQVTFVFRDKAGKEILRHTEAYKHIGQPAWLKEHAGEGMGVIAPYTPIRRQGDTLCVLGREHRFGSGLLPEQITSQGVNLFAEAPVLKARYQGKTIVVDDFKFRRVKESGENTVMSFTASAGELKLSGKVSLEYDGFLWYEVALDQAPVTLDELSVEMVLPKFVAEFINAHFFDRENYVGKLRLPQLIKQIPSVWVGNCQVGLTWVTESFQHWQNRDANGVFAFAEREHGVLWKVRLVDRPTDLSQKRLSYAFGLEANPVKPLPRRFRSIRVNSYYNPIIAHPWDINYPAIKKYKDAMGFYTPEHESMEIFRAEVERFRKKGMELSLYVNPTLLTPQSTEYKIFQREWNNPYGSCLLCPNSSFTDYTTWQIREHIRHGGLRCVYVDSLGAYNCANPLHGCGYVDDHGNHKPTWPVRAARNYMKRLYSLIHAPGVDSDRNFLWAHMSIRTSAPIDAFVDFQCSGEELETRIITNPNYFELYTLDEFQIFFMNSSGVQPMLLPNFGRYGSVEHRYTPKYNDQLVALALLHDVLIWVSWCHLDYVNDIYRKMDEFGLMDPALTFHSYRTQTLVGTLAPEVTISVYQLGRKAVAVVVNKSKSDREIPLTIDFRKLGLPENALRKDLRTGERLPSGNPLKVKVPGYNFRLIQLGE